MSSCQVRPFRRGDRAQLTALVKDYSDPAEEGYVAFLLSAGFRELTKTSRGWDCPISPR